jgi:hypothetical protein
MKFLMSIALGAVLLSSVICLNNFYGNGLIGFVVLMGFTFISKFLTKKNINNRLPALTYYFSPNSAYAPSYA